MCKILCDYLKIVSQLLIVDIQTFSATVFDVTNQLVVLDRDGEKFTFFLSIWL